MCLEKAGMHGVQRRGTDAAWSPKEWLTVCTGSWCLSPSTAPEQSRQTATHYGPTSAFPPQPLPPPPLPMLASAHAPQQQHPHAFMCVVCHAEEDFCVGNSHRC